MDAMVQCIRINVFEQHQRGIIFVLSRQQADDVKDILALHNVTAFAHHSGMSARDRYEAAASWTGQDRGWMVATSGFGAGIDYAHVKMVR